MAVATNETTIARPPDAVWAVVRDYHGLAAWMPGVDSCTADGDDRVLEMMGMVIRERLVRRDDDARVLVYAIADGVPVERHEATITVSPDGDGTRVVWSVDVEPDSMAELMGGIYAQSLEALRAHCEA